MPLGIVWTTELQNSCTPQYNGSYRGTFAQGVLAIAIVIVNSHSQLKIVFRIANAYIQSGLIANPTERKGEFLSL